MIQNVTKQWSVEKCVVFFKVKEAWGGLSNMSNAYPLRVSGLRIGSSEALYQALKYPHLPEVQWDILAQASPMAAKMKAKPHANQRREDWEQVQVPVMHWVLRVKLSQHLTTFGKLLLESGDASIVERSRRDRFWGAVETSEGLMGMNILGQLLMELREELREKGTAAMRQPSVPSFGDVHLPTYAAVAEAVVRSPGC